MTATGAPRTGGRVIELRQYTLVPGRRDELVELFDNEFVVAQEDVGIHVIGQFYDLDDPDRFVWLRGFESMSARADTLPAFYYGPVWARHRAAANATMLDSDNVLLLRPVSGAPAFPSFGRRRGADPDEGLICIDVAFAASRPLVRAAFSYSSLINELTSAGAEVVAILETEPAPNNFPQLPVRDDTAIAAVTRFRDSAHLADFASRTCAGTPYCAEFSRTFAAADVAVQRLRLRPTANSQLR